jgi:RNA polymerase sigma-70 factor (ECF subfamily)
MDNLSALYKRFLVDEPYRLLPPDDLWAKVRDGSDEAAFRVFLERVGGRIYLVCRAVLGDAGHAEEAFQETFCALLRHRAKLPAYRPAVAWLYVTARSQARTIQRRQWRWRWRDRRKAATTEVVGPNASAVPAETERRGVVLAAVGDLPTPQRRAVELVYLEGMTHAEAADALGWSRGAVGKYVQRGLDRLRQVLGRRGLAVAGPTTLGAALQADAATLPAERLAALTDAAWGKAQAVGAWGKLPVLLAGAVLASGLAAGGVALWPRPVLPAPPPIAERETLQAKNLRILQTEVLPKVLVELDRVLPDDAPWVFVDAVAVGSDTRVEFRSGRATPGTAPRRLRMSYCTHMRRFWAGHYDPVDGSWPTGDPEQPAALRMLVPFAQGDTLKLPLVHRNRWAEVVRAFDLLPTDDRTEGELVRYLFGPTGAARGEELTVTVETRAVAANANGLYLCAGNGTYTRPATGGWRYWGMTLGWGMGVDDERLYCYHDQAVWAYRLDAPASPPLKVCDSPERLWLRSLAVAGGTFAAAPMDDRRHEVWVRRTAAADWVRVAAPGHVLAVAVGDGDLFAATADRLYLRPIDRPEAAWTDAGATPKDTLTLFLWGDRLVHVPRGGEPVRARRRTVDPAAAWEAIGRVYHHDTTLSSHPGSS